MRWLDAHSFPSVKCPLGCCIFIDDLEWGTAALMPASHYLRTIIPNFTSFRADAMELAGARPDWPSIHNSLSWSVAPSLVVDSKAGLCFVTCSAGRHARPNHQFIHVPRNPVLKDKPLDYIDPLATATISPNFVRGGGSNRHTTSYSVVRQVGGAGGLSTFRLGVRPAGDLLSPVDYAASGLVLQHRTDIRHSAPNNHTVGPKRAATALQDWSRKQEQYGVANITKCIAGSTSILAHDACHMSKLFNMQHAMPDGVGEGPHAVEHATLGDYLVIVHPNDGIGHPPFDIPYIGGRGQLIDYSAGCVLYTVVQLLVHCRALHRAFIDMLPRPPAPFFRTIQAMCSALTTDMRRRPAVQDLLGAETELKAFVDVPGQEHGRPETFAAAFLAKLGTSTQVATVACQEDTINAVLIAQQSDIVLLEVLGRARRREAAPYTTTDARWTLMAAATVTTSVQAPYAVDLAFRWDPTLEWQSGGTRHERRPPQLMRVLVYVRDTTVLALHRDEVVSWCGGQTKVSCATHAQHLIREGLHSEAMCCEQRCNTPVRWRCPEGFSTDYQCAVGVCFRHMKPLQRHPQPTRLQPRAPQDLPAPHLPPTPPLADLAGGNNHVGEPLPDLIDYGDDEDTEVPVLYAPLADTVADDYVPLATAAGHEATYMAPSHDSLAVHLLLNTHLRVMVRHSFTRAPSVQTQRFLQHICAVTPDSSIPLLYPEATLFPTIFWCEQSNTMCGALPAAMYSGMRHRRLPGRLASVQDHLLVRLLDDSLLTSHDQLYLHWAFDVLINHQLNHNSATVVVRKGLEHLRLGHEGSVLQTHEGLLPFDELDSRHQVQRLAAQMSDVEGFDFFFTATCNDSRTFGVRRVRQAVLELYGHEGAGMQRALLSYCGIMCRCWERTMRYFMYWIEHSPQQPCGRVVSTWSRYEFQSHGAPGNKPHVHGFIKVAGEQETQKLHRIRCNMSAMFARNAGTDRQTLLESGLITDQSEFGDLRALCEMLCIHDCGNAKWRCHKLQTDGSSKCRVQQHPPSLHYSFKGNPHMYNPELLAVLQTLGLSARDRQGRLQAATQLIGGRWQCPADKNETFIPTIPIFFAVLQSCTNVQYIDRRFQVAYVCKYAAGVQEHKEATVSRPTAGGTVTVDVQAQQTITKTGPAGTSSLQPSTSLAREIGQAEMTWYVLGLPFIVTDTVYTHVSTLAPEYRSAVVRTRQSVAVIDGGGEDPIPVQRRRQLPAWRQFTPNQVVVMHQYIDNMYHLDTTWRYSLRPPELKLFDTLQMYCKWFVRGRKCRTYEAAITLAECLWIDGTGHRIFLRKRYIADAADYMSQLMFADSDDVSQPAMELYGDVFNPLQRAADQNAQTPLYLRFVDTAATQRNIVVFSSVTPLQFPRFLVHLLLSKGHFQTEVDLYSCRNLREAFVQTGLLPSVQPSPAEVAILIRSYVTEQLQWLPMGSTQFKNIVLMLPGAFQSFLFDDNYAFDSMPLATDVAISAAASDALQRLEMDRRHAAVAALSRYQFPGFPDVAALQDGAPTMYNPVLHRAPGQTDASFREQESALRALRSSIDTLTQPGLTFVRFPLLVGPPGCGKTHLLMMAQVYALSKGLRAMVLTFTSERAQLLGGQHIHLLFGIPVLDVGVHTVNNIAEMTLSTLAKNPLRMEALRRIQVCHQRLTSSFIFSHGTALT